MEIGLQSRSAAKRRPANDEDAAMTILILGLAIFLGVHSIRIVADGWRRAQIARVGEPAWKLGFSAMSAIGLGLIVWGYGAARQAPVVLWNPPPGMRHAAGLLTLVASSSWRRRMCRATTSRRASIIRWCWA
jgi:uncharacterized membrane protein